MREPPAGVHEAEVLAAISRHWDAHTDSIEHLPVGFGAHHWAAYDGTSPRLFATLDGLEPRHSAAGLEAAYAGATALYDAGLEFVLASVPTLEGTLTTPFADGALSCTPWRHGETDRPTDPAWTTTALTRLHATPPPPGIPHWRPLVGPDFADTTAARTRREWGPGPHAEAARDAVRGHLPEIARWTTRYHHLADVAHDRAWVATHGEPGSHNQLVTAEGRLLVDWESLKLAPAERDLRTLVDDGAQTDADPELLELFGLEWRLDEISQYSAWFAAPHVGTADDDLAFDGLLEELTRE
jgi:spectinomycin phosphotransferase